MASQSKSIVIVDDEPGIRRFVRRVITSHFPQYEVTEAVDGIEAINAIRAQRPSLVVLDLRLPKLGGVEVCRFVRRLWPDTPVIVTTGHTLPEALAQERDLGDAFLAKPFTLDELLTAARALLVSRSPVPAHR